ncbi:DUF3037 domain-containing protein [Nocardioides sp. R-C-SC26]|uniref:DUF3037 domain-containing protein n=1 Tax=Nocardioides sp. R-C-SC26 TaxID=2870414 RepID=UPI001E4D2E2D|nr:DUF3037 domain-containing protein [Nocardioides sp. R-C-SC26]
MTDEADAYQYVVLRCVPRPEREEFLNVGVVVYCQDADLLDVVWHVDGARVHALADDLDLDDLADALAHVDAVCRGDVDRAGAAAAAATSQRFGYLKAPRSTVLQPGPVHGGLTTAPATLAADLLAAIAR